MGENTEAFFSPTWAHGKYLDYWSFVHFLTGTILGIGISLVSEEKLLSLLIVFIMLIIYEILEAKTQVSENLSNIILDIVVGSIGCAMAIFLLPLIMSLNGILATLTLAIIAGIVLVSCGWKNYLKNRASRGVFYSYIHSALLFIYFVGTVAILASIYYLLVI